MTEKHYTKKISSPVGILQLICNSDALTALLWEKEKINRVKLPLVLEEHSTHPVLLKTEQQLTEYFEGTRSDFTVPLKTKGTPFQQSVWEALLNISYGKTRAYREIAQLIHNEKAVRAVGTAIGANPISLIIPCHRVIGSNGHLTGFAGGLNTKAFLLSLEQQTA